MSEGPLAGKTVVISGGSRGIGEAIARRIAADGANITLIAKTAAPHPRLPGDIYQAAKAIEAAGGQALPVVGDIRDDATVAAAVEQTVANFGGLDIVVNNASAIDLRTTEALPMKSYDLMMDINARGAFLLAKHAIPHLRRAANPHILTLSPPLNLDPRWFAGAGVAYTMSKFGMSLVTLGLAEELAGDGIAANSLWPRTAIDTAAVRNVLGTTMAQQARTPAIMADAAYAIFCRPASGCSGRFFIDDEVLLADGVRDFSPYRLCAHDEELALDLWVGPSDREELREVGRRSGHSLLGVARGDAVAL